MSVKTWLLTTMLLGTFVACNKNNKVTQLPVNAPLKAAFNYKPGTYWIYKDSLSGMVDSFAVTSTDDIFSDPISGLNAQKFSIEFITLMVTEYTGSGDTLQWKFQYNQSLVCVYSRDSIFEIQHVPLINYPFSKVLLEQGITSNYGESSSVIDTNASVTINGHLFNNVAVVADTANAFLSVVSNDRYRYADTIFISADVGIVKMNLNHITSNYYRKWELQRLHITK
jgi:hypothetical protein